jgi:hypothetical protein
VYVSATSKSYGCNKKKRTISKSIKATNCLTVRICYLYNRNLIHIF